MAIVRKVVHLRGRVQNVGFRDHVVDVAREHTVAGSVRNLREGSALEIDVEGEASEIETFLAAVLARPPRFARIEGAERSDAEPLGRHGFTRAPSA